MSPGWTGVVLAAVGAVYAASLPFSAWLVWEAHRVRRAERPAPIV